MAGSMGFWREYSIVLGFFLLAYVVVVLFATPGTLLAKGLQFVSADVPGSSDNRVFVRTKMDFGGNDHMKTLPMTIGSWKGRDTPSGGIADALGADVLLKRTYSLRDSLLPVFLLVLQSKTGGSFHPPPVCYQAAGWQIVEKEGGDFVVSDMKWARPVTSPLELESVDRIGGGRSNLDRLRTVNLVVVKDRDGFVEERRVVLYFYVTGAALGLLPAYNDITMIRVSAMAPATGSYEEAAEMTKDFVGELVPLMFEVAATQDMFIVKLSRLRLVGWITIIFLVAVPLGLMVHPWVRFRSRRRFP